jgi:hypothetical protein
MIFYGQRLKPLDRDTRFGGFAGWLWIFIKALIHHIKLIIRLMFQSWGFADGKQLKYISFVLTMPKINKTG